MTTSDDPIIGANYRAYADLQLRRHDLLARGEDHGPGFDAIEDEMTEVWDHLDDAQRDSVNGMASDLNWIRRDGEPPPKGRRPEEVGAVEREGLISAHASKEWHKFLHCMRICASTMSAADLAHLRGNTYDLLDLPAYAAAFYEFAADLVPTSPSSGVVALRAIDRIDRPKALRRAERVASSPFRFPPLVLAMSVAMLLRRDEERGPVADGSRYASLLRVARGRLDLGPAAADAENAMFYQLAASCFETLDDLPAALDCYEKGLEIAPDHETLLIGLGLLLYGSQTGRAVGAFRRVANGQGSSLVWPYFFLAHHDLTRGNHAGALDLINQAWPRAGTAVVQAELLGWQAICLDEMGYAAVVVRSLFDEALALDPANDRIRRNVGIFDSSTVIRGVDPWDIESDEVLRAERAPKMSEIMVAA